MKAQQLNYLSVFILFILMCGIADASKQRKLYHSDSVQDEQGKLKHTSLSLFPLSPLLTAMVVVFVGGLCGGFVVFVGMLSFS